MSLPVHLHSWCGEYERRGGGTWEGQLCYVSSVKAQASCHLSENSQLEWTNQSIVSDYRDRQTPLIRVRDMHCCFHGNLRFFLLTGNTFPSLPVLFYIIIDIHMLILCPHTGNRWNQDVFYIKFMYLFISLFSNSQLIVLHFTKTKALQKVQRKPTHCQTDRQTVRQTVRQTHTHTDTHTQYGPIYLMA